MPSILQPLPEPFPEPMTIFYSREHQWIDMSDRASCPVGITPHAQETLGDIVFVELPEVGKTLAAGEIAAVVESVKAASDVFMPMAGEVIAINEALQAEPSLANSSPLARGWFFRIRPVDPASTANLLNEQTYAAYASSGSVS